MVYFQVTRTTPELSHEELNDVQIRLPPINRASRSSLNAYSSTTPMTLLPGHNSNNKLDPTVTTAIVTMPTPSPNADEVDPERCPSSMALTDMEQLAPQHNSPIVRISTL